MAKSGKTEPKNKLKSFLLYGFLFYIAFVTADLVMLKFVRPQFIFKIAAKNKLKRVASFEPETKGFEISELGASDVLTGRIVSRNIFNSGDMPPALAKIKKGPTTEVFEDGDPVLSGLQLTLEGTAVHRNPFRSLATITGSGDTKTYTVGDDVAGMAEVVSVIRKKVIIRNSKNRKLEYIEITRDQKRAAPVVAKNRFRAPKPKPSTLIKRDGNRFTAKRADVNAQLSNISGLAKQANSRLYRDPATGEALGYQIFGIKPGLLQDLGVQNDDVILKINDQKVNNPGKAMSMFNTLKGASEINLRVMRGGSEVDLEYIVE